MRGANAADTTEGEGGGGVGGGVGSRLDECLRRRGTESERTRTCDPDGLLSSAYRAVVDSLLDDLEMVTRTGGQVPIYIFFDTYIIF